MMTVERLHQIFDDNANKNVIGFEGKCHDCDSDIKVDISLVPEGFLIREGLFLSHY